MYFETATLLGTLLLLLYAYVRRKWTVLKKWNIPHDPPSFRNFGNALLVFTDDCYKYELRCKKKFGNIWGYYMMTEPRIVIHDPEILRRIMVKEFSKFPNRFVRPRDFGLKGLEEGVLAAEGEKWKRMRSALTPSFSNVKLKAMSKLIKWCIFNMMEQIDKRIKNGNQVCSVREDFNKLSLDVICSAAFSIDLNSQDDSKPLPEIAKHSEMFFDNGLLDKVRILVKVSFPGLGEIIGDGHRSIHLQYMKHFIQAIIHKNSGDSVTSARSDIMRAMLGARKTKTEVKSNPTAKGMTDSEITANAISMLLAGFETTAVSMTYFAYNLALHPEVQERLQQEIDEAFLDKDDIDFETALNITYLDMCIKESLRLYCAIGKTARCATQEVVLDGKILPRGALIHIPIISLCHDPEYWDEPLEFKPSRMEKTHDLDPIIYQPFGHGPRNCLGMKFAVAEMKLTFCTILRKYTILPTDETPKPPLSVKQFVTSCPTSDIKLKISRR